MYDVNKIFERKKNSLKIFIYFLLFFYSQLGAVDKVDFIFSYLVHKIIYKLYVKNLNFFYQIFSIT